MMLHNARYGILKLLKCYLLDAVQLFYVILTGWKQTSCGLV